MKALKASADRGLRVLLPKGALQRLPHSELEFPYSNLLEAGINISIN